MKISHIAIWSKNIEKLAMFYENYFNAVSSKKYINSEKGFSSYFLSFDSGARLELMQMISVKESINEVGKNYLGYAHLAISVETKEKVDQLTAELGNDGFTIIDRPRFTGDGYYESVVLDPDGNKVEITV